MLRVVLCRICIDLLTQEQGCNAVIISSTFANTVEKVPGRSFRLRVSLRDCFLAKS
jgi:hypothetical protein